MCQSSAGVWELQGLLSTPGVCGLNSARPAVFSEVQGVKEWIWATIGKEQGRCLIPPLLDDDSLQGGGVHITVTHQ